MALYTISYQSCQARIAEPRQKPMAVSEARIGVLTALMPIPINKVSLESSYVKQVDPFSGIKHTNSIDDPNAEQLHPVSRKDCPEGTRKDEKGGNGHATSSPEPEVYGQ